jgi:hypothetical protein
LDEAGDDILLLNSKTWAVGRGLRLIYAYADAPIKVKRFIHPFQAD